ncbi:MAG: hypothetical protein LH477_18405 [Nocardioides sp.]|nr:hypothetical protein [Nocardioides sp.]
MSRITGVIVALATATAVLTASSPASTVGAAAPPGAAELPREIPNGVELTLADGDRFRVWTSDNFRTVWGKRFDAATASWGGRAVVVRRKNLECGDVDARTSNGAVAVIAECDPGYSEDTAPTSSRALWSADTVTWSSYELEGEAYEEPGISPNGANAVWPERGGYVILSPTGFARHRLDTRGQEYTTTATITDEQQVSYLYGAQLDNRCRIVVQSRTGDAKPTRQELPLEDGCSDSSFENLDADTAWFGDSTDPAQRSTIARVDAASPWAVTEIAPVRAPGLVTHDTGRLSTDFFRAPGLPLLALGAARGRRLRAQSYDSATQSWGPERLAYAAGAGKKCGWGDTWIEPPLDVIAVDLVCGARDVVLTTADGITWRALPMGGNTYGVSPDGRFVAVPSRSQTHVISAERGVVTLLGGVTGQCDVVVPDGPGAAVLLTAAGRHRGWPTILKTSGPSGWQRPSRTKLPTFAEACAEAGSTLYDLPYRFAIHSRWKGYSVRIVQRDGVWTVRRGRF